jgi:hypothetical protein
VVMTGQNKDGTSYRKVQAEPEDCVKIASMLPKIDLTVYGVDPRLAATMDSAAMVCVDQTMITNLSLSLSLPILYMCNCYGFILFHIGRLLWLRGSRH